MSNSEKLEIVGAIEAMSIDQDNTIEIMVPCRIKLGDMIITVSKESEKKINKDAGINV